MLPEDCLLEIGFSTREQEVYLALAKLGKSTATTIAKTCGLPRSTAYSVLEQLLGRGVISVDQAGSLAMYIANPPSSVQRMVEDESRLIEKEANAKRTAVEQFVQSADSLFKNENFSVPKLTFFEGNQNVRNMLYDNLKHWQKSILQNDATWWGYQDHQFVVDYQDWIAHHAKTMHKDERVWLFSNQSQVEKKLKGKIARREIRLLPEGFEYSSTIWVLGDYVITVMTRQKPHYAFQLKDAVFARNQRCTFQLLWNLTDKLRRGGQL